MKTWRMIIDVSKCEDCNNCLLACKDEHVGNTWPGHTKSQPRHGHRWISVARKEHGQFPLVSVAYRPTPCQQCADAPCVKNSNGAVMQRQDGIVLIDPDRAKGQSRLADSCPYGMIWWNDEEQVAQKCTLCAHLLDAGWTQTRCSQACPTGALQLLQMENTEAEALLAAKKLSTFHPEFRTQPRVLYKNLGMFESCSIAGSIAVEVDGRVDCAAGASIILWQAGLEIARTDTNAFGDFRFDGLEPDSSDYNITIRLSGFETRKISVRTLQESMSLGTVCLMLETAETTR